MMYAAIHRDHGHIAESFASTAHARSYLLRRSETTFGRNHRWAVVSGDGNEIREVSPHEIALITDQDYADIHGDKAP